MAKKYDFQNLNSEKFIVLDIETTGFSPDKGGRIIELGMVKINKNGDILDSYKEYFNPLMKIPKKITSITGIDDDMVKDAPYIFTELLKISDFIGNYPVVCHNLQFDWNRFLLTYFKKIGIIKTNPTIDTLKLARYTFPNEDEYKLANCCLYCEVPMRVAHRAYDDAVMTSECFVKMIELNQEEIDKTKPLIIKEKENTNPEIEIKRISYWEGHGYHRHYVNMFYNTSYLKVFYDIDNDYWKVNDEYDIEKIGNEINWHRIEESILKYTGTKNKEEFKKWRR